MSEQWFYAAAGQQRGPVSTNDLQSLIAGGQVAANDLAWKEGMPQWTAVSLLPELLAVGPAAATTAYDLSEAAPLPQVNVPLSYGGYEQYAQGVGGVQYGGFWIRFCAAFIDGIILWVPNFVVQLGVQSVIRSMVAQTSKRGGPPNMVAIVGAALSSMAVQILVDWVYYALMESSSKQATLGKMACGLVVTDLSGKRITFGRATARYFAKTLSALILYIGYIMAGFDERKRALHDQLAKTYVVKKASLAPRM